MLQALGYLSQEVAPAESDRDTFSPFLSLHPFTLTDIHKIVQQNRPYIKHSRCLINALVIVIPLPAPNHPPDHPAPPILALPAPVIPSIQQVSGILGVCAAAALASQGPPARLDPLAGLGPLALPAPHPLQTPRVPEVIIVVEYLVTAHQTANASIGMTAMEVPGLQLQAEVLGIRTMTTPTAVDEVEENAASLEMTAKMNAQLQMRAVEAFLGMVGGGALNIHDDMLGLIPLIKHGLVMDELDRKREPLLSP